MNPSLLSEAVAALMVGFTFEGVSIVVVFVDGTSMERVVPWEVFHNLLEVFQSGIEEVGQDQ